MELEEIVRMDEEIFDEEKLKKAFFSMGKSTPTLPGKYAIQAFQHFAEYDEKYGINLLKDADMSMLQEYPSDTWINNARFLLDSVITEGGWHKEEIWSDDERLPSISEDLELEKSVEEMLYSAYLRIRFSNNVTSLGYRFLYPQLQTVKDMVTYLESGCLCVIWNNRIDKFMKYYDSSVKRVKLVCSDEVPYIMNLLGEVWNPFISAHMQEASGLLGPSGVERRYIRALLGSDGISSYSFDALNPNWICKAVKLDLLLEKAIKKLEEDFKEVTA